jgi:lipoprotein NlpD
MVKRLLTISIAVLWLAGCAPWAPAPVEDRSRLPERERPAEPRERVVSAPPSFYEVRSGDTLYSIAFRYGMDWRSVARWNDIEAPFTIRPGQELRLTEPPRTRPPAATRPEPTPTEPVVARVEEPEPEPEPERPEPSRPDVRETPSRPDPVAETRAPAPSASTNSRSVAGVEWQWPTSGSVIRPFDASATRRGIGIGGSQGQPVHAAAAGQVVYSGTALIGYGELIIIKHSDNLLSAYGHNRVRMVEEGDRVGRGEQIAEMGMNERDQELLHFEIRRDGQPVDPMSYLPRR